MKIKNMTNGEPDIIKTDIERFEICCDCGLVHFIRYRVINKKTIRKTVYRDDYETAKRRKGKK